ncbi:hypothetical protein T484DRAFT_1764864 [Baffinella frigidus]|nr:hypothetical protein T484DRAFT_1764864 [Cryptophyta sp. CCMP2293]
MRRFVIPLLLCADVAAAFAPGIQLPGAFSRPACSARSPYAGARLGNAGPALALRRGAARPGRAAGLMMMSTSVDVKAVEDQIQAQGEVVRSMKEAMKADAAAHSKADLSAAVDTLKALKAKIAAPAEPKKTEPAPPKQQKAKPAQSKKTEAAISPREERAVRAAKAEKLREKGVNPYAYTWDISASTTALQEEHKALGNGEIAEGAAVSVAGRIMAKRVFGKLAFYTLADGVGTIQLYLEQDAINTAGIFAWLLLGRVD